MHIICINYNTKQSEAFLAKKTKQKCSDTLYNVP